MSNHIKLALVLGLFGALVFAAPVAAQDGGSGDPLPCADDSVSGTVVAVDEDAQEVTLYTGDGSYCTVSLETHYDHPIVALLGEYFDDLTPEGLTEDLDTRPGGCATYDTTSQTWMWADCSAPDAVEVTVIAENEDGSFVIKGEVAGEEVTGDVTIDDETAAEELSEALQKLMYDWNLDETGAVIQAGGEIAAYHDDGMGFGVLVKLYGMADEWEKACEGMDAPDPESPCGVTPHDLVDLFQSGTGMGHLFKEYGKPITNGIGHVRKMLRGAMTEPVDGSFDDDDEDGDEDEAGDELLTYHTASSSKLRPSRGRGRPEHAGPKPKSLEQADTKPNKGTGKPDNAGPKPKDSNPGKSDNAGPKPKDTKPGKPDNAGPKPKPTNNGGKPANAGPKPKSGKKDK